MKFTTNFNLKDSVKVKELNITGKISGFFIDSSGEIQYRVRTIKDYEIKELYFYKDDLELVTNKEKSVGFN